MFHFLCAARPLRSRSGGTCGGSMVWRARMEADEFRGRGGPPKANQRATKQLSQSFECFILFSNGPSLSRFEILDIRLSKDVTEQHSNN